MAVIFQCPPFEMKVGKYSPSRVVLAICTYISLANKSHVRFSKKLMVELIDGLEQRDSLDTFHWHFVDLKSEAHRYVLLFKGEG
uniref:NET domain-containing protein n=1 Tax=Parascaris univalens TaxID=6257 RepID=A0A915A2U2_PARUN